jgi:excisionase family DNA binding protein
VQITLALDDAAIDRLADELAEYILSRLPASEAGDRWLSSREAADYLALPLSTLRKLSAADALPAYQDTPSGCLYFKRSELDEWRRSGGSRR